MTITKDDVRQLLHSDLPDPVLLFLEGRSQVVDGSVLRRPDYAGAMLIATREELDTRLGGAQPQDRELAEVAAQLDVQVGQMGA